MDIDSKSSEFENMDININIGNMLFNIILDISFFNSSEDFSFPCHNHGAFELHIIEKGQGELETEGQCISLSEGVCCLIAPNIFHTQKDLPDHRIYKYCMKFTFRVIKADHSNILVSESRNISKLLSNNACFHWHDNGDTLNLVKTIQTEIVLKRTGYYTKIQSCFMQIIVNIIRSISENTYANYEINKKNIDQKRPLIIEMFFFNQYMRNASIDDLAEQLGVSIRQTDRILRKYYNLSFKEKHLETRINVSKNMLLNTTNNICSIAEKVGYDQAGNFSRIFKKKVGVTPGEFRSNALRKKSP